MTGLLDHCLSYLKRHYANYETWRTLTSHGPEGFSLRHAIGVVNLARFTGEDTLLPTALLACCQLSSRIVDGFECEDGKFEYLSREDLGRCFKATQELISMTVTNVLHAFDPQVSKQCEQPRACETAFRDILAEMQEGAPYFSMPDPFQYPATHFFTLFERDLCSECWRLVKARVAADQKHAWNHLPETIGLEVKDWQDID